MLGRLRLLKRKLCNPYFIIDHLLKDHLRVFGPYIRGHCADFGCGDFRLSLPFRHRLDSLIGVDNWLASDYHQYVPEGAKFFYGSIDEAPFPNNAFDCVLCTEVLEHVESPEKVIQECSRVLVKDGILLLSIPFNFLIHGAPNDFRRLTIYGLKLMLEKEGFEMKAYMPVGDTFWGILNTLSTHWGFKTYGKLGKFFNSIRIFLLNLFGFLVYRKRSEKDVFTDTDRNRNDRTNPLGYVLIAKAKKSVDGEVACPEEFVVCPKCYGSLEFAEGIKCGQCEASFRYYEGFPVLAEREKLHLEFEDLGKKVEF